MMGLGFSPLRQAWNFPFPTPLNVCSNVWCGLHWWTSFYHECQTGSCDCTTVPTLLEDSRVKGTTTRWWAKTVDAVQSIVKYSTIIQKLLRKTSQGIKDVEVYFKTCWGEFSNYILLSRCPVTGTNYEETFKVSLIQGPVCQTMTRRSQKYCCQQVYQAFLVGTSEIIWTFSSAVTHSSCISPVLY